MDWLLTLQWPSAALLIAALVAVFVALACGVSARRRWAERRHVAATWRFLCLLIFLAAGLLAGGAGVTLRGWHRLSAETQILSIVAHHLDSGAWSLDLSFANGDTRRVRIRGDAWRVESVILKWKLPAVLAGVPPLYRLDRLSGRYANPEQAASTPPSIISFNRGGDLDLALLHDRYPHWLPMVDTIYGGGVYLPLVDGGHYTVSLMATGALVARRVPRRGN